MTDQDPEGMSKLGPRSVVARACVTGVHSR
jgi:hypothetical protein